MSDWVASLEGEFAPFINELGPPISLLNWRLKTVCTFCNTLPKGWISYQTSSGQVHFCNNFLRLQLFFATFPPNNAFVVKKNKMCMEKKKKNIFFSLWHMRTIRVTRFYEFGHNLATQLKIKDYRNQFFFCFDPSRQHAK